MAEAERASATGMLCPTCKVDLIMAERQNVEVGYCPKCRGIWLDRGELDKIVERSATQAPDRSDRPEMRDDHYGSRKHSGRYGHRRKSWLEEIFD
jgi:Zn-finger nucleic acid-binding protein